MASQALPKRSTRGLRMNKLLEDEDSADEEFWNQDAFAEEEGDDAYESESEEQDVFDADFNDDESSSDSEEVVVAKERRKPALKAPERKAPPAPRRRNPRRPARLAASTRPSPGRSRATPRRGTAAFVNPRAAASSHRAIGRREAARHDHAQAQPQRRAPRQLAGGDPRRGGRHRGGEPARSRAAHIEEAVKKKAGGSEDVSGPIRPRAIRRWTASSERRGTRMGATLPAPLGAQDDPGDGAVRHHEAASRV